MATTAAIAAPTTSASKAARRRSLSACSAFESAAWSVAYIGRQQPLAIRTTRSGPDTCGLSAGGVASVAPGNGSLVQTECDSVPGRNPCQYTAPHMSTPTLPSAEAILVAAREIGALGLDQATLPMVLAALCNPAT